MKHFLEENNLGKEEILSVFKNAFEYKKIEHYDRLKI